MAETNGTQGEIDPRAFDPSAARPMRVAPSAGLEALKGVAHSVEALVLGALEKAKETGAGSFSVTIQGPDEVAGSINIDLAGDEEVSVEINGKLGGESRELPGTPYKIPFNCKVYRRPAPEKEILANDGDDVKPGDPVGWFMIGKKIKGPVKTDRGGTVRFAYPDSPDGHKVKAGDTVFYIDEK